MKSLRKEGRVWRKRAWNWALGNFSIYCCAEKKGKTSGISEVQGKLRECWWCKLRKGGVSARKGLSVLLVALRLKIRNSHWWCGHEVIVNRGGSHFGGLSLPVDIFARPKFLWVIMKNHCPLLHRTSVSSCVIPRTVLSCSFFSFLAFKFKIFFSFPPWAHWIIFIILFNIIFLLSDWILISD